MKLKFKIMLITLLSIAIASFFHCSNDNGNAKPKETINKIIEQPKVEKKATQQNKICELEVLKNVKSWTPKVDSVRAINKEIKVIGNVLNPHLYLSSGK